MILNQNEQAVSFQIARLAINAKLHGTRPVFPDIGNLSGLNQPLGVFVTIKINGELRGCIGVFESDQPLFQTIADMAVATAFDDPRFEPLTLAELPKIKIEISILSPMKKITDSNEIEIGKHGVYLKQGRRSGVYLPQVATEMNWGKEDLLNSLCTEKAGLPVDCWKDPKTEMFVFEAEAFGE